jgi:DNA-binding Xre family transcriptional regulator
MAGDGTPEMAAKRVGRVIAQLRNARDWSRSKLIARLHNELDENDPSCDHLSEAWLVRLEDGRMVKVQRHLIDALCRALGCSPRERARVLLAADRNLFAGDSEVASPVAEALNFLSLQLRDEAEEIVADLVGQDQLDGEELDEIMTTVLEVVLRRRRKRG